MTYEGLGVSEYTPTKQENLRAILRWHLGVTRYVMPKWNGCEAEYCFFDLTAGPGRYQTDSGVEVEGSPLIFLEAVREAQMPYRAVMIEQCRASYTSLCRNIAPAANIKLHCGNHNVILSEYCNPHLRAFGLVYCDPTNHQVPFTALSHFCRAYPKVDVLIHVAANAIKRASADDDPDLLSRLGVLNKRHWLAKEPTGKWQWTFLLGSNGDNVFKDYKKIGLYRTETATGRDIIQRINYTREEQRERQQLTLISTR